MARRSLHRRQEFSFPGDPPPPPMARRADADDDRRGLPPRRPSTAAEENRLAPRAGEEDFRWLQASTPGSPESGSGTPSPQLWAPHPYYDRLYPASAGSSPSRAQAIAGYRREMLDLVRGLPEAAYELSLRDIVESRGPSPLPPPPPPPPAQLYVAAMQDQERGEPRKHVATAAMPMNDEHLKKQSSGKMQGKARKQRSMGRTRSRSVERSVSLDTGLLIKLFMPLSVGRKKKVSPKPAALAGAAKEGKKKKTKKEKQGKNKKEEEEWWQKSEFSEAGSSRTSSTGSSSTSNSSASRNGTRYVNGGGNLQAPARSRSRKRIGCYGFFRPNKSANGVIEE